MTKVELVEGQTAPVIMGLVDRNGQAAGDFSGFQVSLELRSHDGTAVNTSGKVLFDDAVLARVKFYPDADDLQAALSPYLARWWITDTDGKAAPFPDGEADQWIVRPATVALSAGSVVSGAGASLLHQGAKALVHSEILQLPTAEQVLIAAPTAARTMIPDMLAVHSQLNGVPYGNVWAQAELQTFFGTAGPFFAAFREDSSGQDGFCVSGMLQNSTIQWAGARGGLQTTNPAGGGLAGAPSTYGNGYFNSVTAFGDYVGVFLRNNGANLTGGHVDDILRFIYSFYVYDADRGRFLTPAESGWIESTRTFGI